MLLARHQTDDAERARDLLQNAVGTARNLAMTALAEHAMVQLAATAS